MISPGASSGSNTVEEKLSNLQNQQEIENLKCEVRDLQEKIETLKGMPAFILKSYLIGRRCIFKWCSHIKAVLYFITDFCYSLCSGNCVYSNLSK